MNVDWHDLPSGPTLDRLIAETLGMKILDGTALTKTGEYINQWWETSTGPKEIPRFSTDLNAAFTLFQTELGLGWNLFLDTNDWITCELGHWSDDWHEDQVTQGCEKTPALAICKAWLAWQDRTDHPHPEIPKGL